MLMIPRYNFYLRFCRRDTPEFTNQENIRRKNDTVEYTAALALRHGIAMVVVSGYWYTGVCARVLISHVRQVQDRSVCVRFEVERYSVRAFATA